LSASSDNDSGARVLILERASRVLQKVKISGGGRCNVTHDCLDPKRMASNYPRGNKALIGPLHRFGVRETMRWFEGRGVELKTEADGRMFPTTDDSQTVINCLTDAADQAGVELRTGAYVQRIRDLEDDAPARFELVLRDDERIHAQNVLLATGGTRSQSGAEIARGLGHSLNPAVPSLFTFCIDDPRIDDLQGLSVEHTEVEVIGEALADHGPLLITHWGMSGPGILKLSAWGARELHALAYTFDIEVNWLPEVDVEQRFHELRADWGKRQVVSRSPFDQIPKRLWERLVDAAKVPAECRWAEFPKKMSRALAKQLTRARFKVTGKSTNKDEFVTCGGVPSDEVDWRTMQSRHTPGLYFAGELLDIDGVTGGYNFQNAWTTGYLAGQAIAVFQSPTSSL
jgi:predicted Rossmann fold flavoprotein